MTGRQKIEAVRTDSSGAKEREAYNSQLLGDLFKLRRNEESDGVDGSGESMGFIS